MWIQEVPERRMTLLRWNSPLEPEGGPPGFDEPLASDRPDFTEASSTVGLGVVQIEMGYTFLRDEELDTRFTAHSFPEVLARIGLFAEWFELRISTNFSAERHSAGTLLETVSGLDDLYLGAKLGLTQQQGAWPEMVLMPQMLVPLGGETSVHRLLPGLSWLYGWDVCEWLSTGGSTIARLSVEGSPDAEYLEFAQSWTVGYTLTERLGAYTEWFVLVPVAAQTAPTEHYFDGGFTLRVTNNLQLDIRAGWGLSRRAVDFFSGAGMVVRF